ncbi:MAG TPA: hypothetical protein DCR24_08010 [Bacillus bacterium]|nr:hypothetical protein [Bacillus sp. (in: firmicutes)]
MYRLIWNALLIVAIGAGFYFYVELVFTKVTDPLYSSFALLMGCLFSAGILRELMLMSPLEHENSQI